MAAKRLIEEFEFLRGKLEQIARLMAEDHNKHLAEIAFMIGCLHNICHEHAQKLKLEANNAMD